MNTILTSLFETIATRIVNRIKDKKGADFSKERALRVIAICEEIIKALKAAIK